VVVRRPEDLAPALERLLDDDARARLRAAAKRLIPENGAQEAARLIVGRGSTGGAPETSARPPSPTPL
jgi:hypothetical protein